MAKMSFYNRERNKNNMQQLTDALSKRDTSTINIGGIGSTAPRSNNSQNDDNTVDGALNFAKGGMKLYNALKDSNSGNDIGGSGLFSRAANDYITTGNTTSSTPIMDAINGTGGSESVVGDSINTEVGGGTAGGGSVPWALIGKAGKFGYNTISGKDDKDYSDLEQSTVYPLQGASMGAQFGPWGAAAGALYGLGYSFKDDIGLKDNDFLTDIIFPIGMGDEHNGLIQL